MIKRKILFVAPYPPPYSGPETSAKLFMESKIHDFYEVNLFDTNFRKSNADKGKLGFSAILIFFKFILGLIKRLVFFNPDIVYYYVTATKVGWLYKDIWLILVSKLFGKKVVIHMRAGHFDYNFSKMSSFQQSIIKKVCKYVDFGLAQSYSLMSQFDEILPVDKVGFVYNMINVNLYKPESGVKNHKEIFFMGHLTKAKGYNDILHAMPKVVEKHPDALFTFAGSKLKDERNVFNDYTNKAPLINEDSLIPLTKLLKNGYAKNYNYLGIIDEQKKIAQFNKSQLFILPSFSEGFSMAVLEAMSMGKPVITTPVGALKDIITNKENGYLVSPGNVDEIAKAIITLLDNPKDCDEISATNRNAVVLNYSIQNVVNKYIEIFNKI
jgi:glycosyltransferase involved in cell wall biosynthesis|tara:strand:+ start:3018 stop:4163 length:1146 start_codon:yes stop_codon:yes gene_type:complete